MRRRRRGPTRADCAGRCWAIRTDRDATHRGTPASLGIEAARSCGRNRRPSRTPCRGRLRCGPPARVHRSSPRLLPVAGPVGPRSVRSRTVDGSCRVSNSARRVPRRETAVARRRERVTRVIDGDTFETAVRTRPVRLARVNAPEKRQPGYQAAKRRLEQLIGRQLVEVEVVARDTYGRPVANVRVDGRSVNAAMREAVRRAPR
ncbi:MAG: thermonuclease family protein [Chloroflexi bacterium]|nr:thermonuclease family protein [Chloroflexota bacterium]